jgi:ankyrin repeat protein
MAEAGNTEEVKAQILKGADANPKAKDGYSALCWAAYNGHAVIVKMLIEAGADINSISKDGYSALSLAAEAPSAAQERTRLGFLPRLANEEDDFSEARAREAAAGTVGHADIVKMLITAGADFKLESFASNFSKNPIVVDAVESVKIWRRRRPFVIFVEWLTKLEDPPALPVVAALLSGGPITRQIAKFV